MEPGRPIVQWEKSLFFSLSACSVSAGKQGCSRVCHKWRQALLASRRKQLLPLVPLREFVRRWRWLVLLQAVLLLLAMLLPGLLLLLLPGMLLLSLMLQGLLLKKLLLQELLHSLPVLSPH